MYQVKAFYVDHKNGILQGSKYLVTGAASFVADYSVFWVLLRFFHNLMIATYTGLVIGLIVNYIMSKLWAFKNKNTIDTKEVASFLIVTAAGFSLTGIGMYTGVYVFGIDASLTKIVVAVLVFALNFLVRKYIIWKED